MQTVNYELYLHSEAWRKKSLAAMRRAGFRCQVCNRSGRLNTHHRTYERLGREKPTDLTCLCRDCHEIFSLYGRMPK